MSAVSAEIVDGALPEKRLSPRLLRHNVPACTPNAAGAPHDGGGPYRCASLVSAVMLGSIGPVKPFLFKYLITHTHAAAPNEPPTRSNTLAQ